MTWWLAAGAAGRLLSGVMFIMVVCGAAGGGLSEAGARSLLGQDPLDRDPLTRNTGVLGGGQGGSPFGGAPLSAWGGSALPSAGAAGLTGALPMGAMPMDQIFAMAGRQGYSSLSGLEVEGGQLKAVGRSSAGFPVDLVIDPATGQVLSVLLH